MLFLLAAYAAVAVAIPWWQPRLGRAVWAVAALVPLATVAWAGTRAARVLDGGEYRETLAWAPSLGLTVDLRLDPLSLLMLWVVAGVGALVLLYCRYYVERDAARQAALLLAFAGAMTGLVLADNVFVLYVFWELTTVASFLLIAGRGEEENERRAARQALLVTVAGGLVMLLGLVLLGWTAGTYRISAILADPPRGGAVSAAAVLVLIGAFAKSAQMPLHGWLPAAMVAPTPVSAYLHAAAMVKAGVYLVARLAPALAEVAPWRPMVLAVGLTTMVLAAWRALRATDLKLLLAYGTISELGLLVTLLGAGTRTAALAGAVMLLAHAAFKSALFLSVGILDHRAGTRDIRELSGVGRRMPVLFAVTALAAASMAGIPPLVGYLGKEAYFEAFLYGDARLDGHRQLTVVLVIGSALTVAYAARFVQGAFGGPPEGAARRAERPEAGFVAPVAVLAGAGLALGVGYAGTAALAAAYADAYPPGPHGPYELSLWHGFTPVLGLSALTLALGGLVHLGRRSLPVTALLPDAQRAFDRTVAAADRLALTVTRHTQVGSLPLYLVVLLTTVVVVPGAALAAGAPPLGSPLPWWSPVEPFLAVVVLTAAAAVVGTRHRLTGILLTGAVGYGVAGMFLVRGAPDLALTQFLVETMTLVVVVLVLRRMPARFSPGRTMTRVRLVRAAAAGAVGVLVTCFALVASAARAAPAISSGYAHRMEEAGAENIVNAIVVDFRALDTLGEISVLLVAAVGTVSLIRVGGRGDARTPGGGPGGPSPTAHWDEPVRTWLPGAPERPGGERSVLLEVATCLLFPSILVLSLFLLFSGHYGPGGGFAGGLVAGQALVLRYLVGGRADLGAAVRVPASVVTGSGMLLAAAVGTFPLLLGGVPLESTVVTLHPPVVGTVKFATSLFFDVGVYLLVVGVVLELLSAVGVSLGQDMAEADEAEATAEDEEQGGPR
ncbi:Na+/H+ antiporter subunit A [Streptomyces caelestis]|uniref:Na+/H+ antiporter subunit A n=1 Tax=Streptomyces caelestis TaxID=36816 RepID=UPI00344BFD6E